MIEYGNEYLLTMVFFDSLFMASKLFQIHNRKNTVATKFFLTPCSLFPLFFIRLLPQVTSSLLPLAEFLFPEARLLLALTAFFNMVTASFLFYKISVGKKNRFPPRPQTDSERISTM